MVQIWANNFCITRTKQIPLTEHIIQVVQGTQTQTIGTIIF